MTFSRKAIAALGAVALAGGLSLSATSIAFAEEAGAEGSADYNASSQGTPAPRGVEPQADESEGDTQAAPDAVVVLTDGSGPVVTATLSGCSVEDEVSTIEAVLYDNDLGMEFGGEIYDAPASGDIAISVVAPLPNNYYLDAYCFGPDDASSDDDDKILMDEPFQVQRALLNLTGDQADGTWQVGDPTTINSVAVETEEPTAFAHAFDPSSTVTITVTDPAGNSYDVAEFNEHAPYVADENGDLSLLAFLPFTVDGTYEITATGAREGQPVVLFNTYTQVVPEEPAPEPSEPAPSDPAPEKPAELPKTGGEGVDPAPIALLVGVAAAAGAAALRSRKH
ncbi:hypothetical protein [Propionimicrobium sp. PCR01-08-3]|uniref:hypothetical protein n=1 Tax=Propionimicrobium sp. PCR01-08-3 TaxID=3052086 RepID=UPI00255CE5C5|nr:hypothetical protein [Propionimicrobium sp. PCR01-08-3]WIY83167.1 hypothetical protein QQ658_02065 [Propionimicrobium sp. PCR01-08-3]